MEDINVRHAEAPAECFVKALVVTIATRLAAELPKSIRDIDEAVAVVAKSLTQEIYKLKFGGPVEDDVRPRSADRSSPWGK